MSILFYDFKRPTLMPSKKKMEYSSSWYRLVVECFFEEWVHAMKDSGSAQNRELWLIFGYASWAKHFWTKAFAFWYYRKKEDIFYLCILLCTSCCNVKHSIQGSGPSHTQYAIPCPLCSFRSLLCPSTSSLSICIFTALPVRIPTAQHPTCEESCEAGCPICEAATS